MQTHNYSKFFIFNNFNLISILSVHGRLSRTGFWAYNILLYILLVLIILKLNSLNLSDLQPKTLLRLITTPSFAIDQFPLLRGILPVLCAIYLSFCLSIKRLHDLNHSGYRSLLLLIPIINLMLLLYLLFAEGGHRANRFGHPVSYPLLERGIILMSVAILAISPLLLKF